METRYISLFARKIKCQHCGKNFKKKTQRMRVSYVCNNYDNFGKCVRNSIKEEFLVELIEKRLGVQVDREVIEKHINIIMIENVDPILLEIHFYEQESIQFTRNGIRY